MRGLDRVAVTAALAATLACGRSGGSKARLDRSYVGDPLAVARGARDGVAHVDANVPAQCYARTLIGDEARNPCWVCHTGGSRGSANLAADAHLQGEYSFSSGARVNGWTNLFEDRRREAATLSEDAVLAWIRTDNYASLVSALRERSDYGGFVPDLDLRLGFDARGFARDKSRWRAVRYKPFPGAFWPTNGGAGDVFVRLPARFAADEDGRPSEETYAANLELLAAAIASPAEAELPRSYVGLAKSTPLRRGVYPEGAELLHTVRYLDPDAPNLLSVRLKELRYMRKARELDTWGHVRAYEREAEERDEQRAPRFAGSGEVGLLGPFGWQLQGFIEDERGALRAQTDEETRACMGCHGSLGVTVDHTFSLARKVPGPDGWRWQDLAGMKDVPERGHRDPEALVYMRRARSADDFDANDEMRARFFRDGRVDEAEVRRAGPGGDRDLAWLLGPSRQRALDLDRATMLLVARQSFARGREPTLLPVLGVRREVDEGELTGLVTGRAVHRDGEASLDW